ncbi:glycosyltransferase family 39 protein [Candidatus Parcubacteria bacterium]|nr:MAG: glycosyltransferase family 39 protein [Candidatus Parcubacteria bacterium]
MIVKILRHKYFQMTGVLIVSALIIFYNLGGNSAFNWDESRYAVSALEMIKTGKWLVAQYNYFPDTYNVRPPLGIWLIAIIFRLFGVNEFTLRFWSAAFAVLTAVVIYAFGTEVLNKKAALMAVGIYLTTSQYINIWVARTADFNAGINFFILLSIYLFYLSFKYHKKRYFFLSAITVGLGFMYKSIIGLTPIFIISAFLLAVKKIKRYTFIDYIFYCLIIAGIIFPWLIYRYLAGSDFFIQMFKFDFYQRTFQGVEGHLSGYDFYVNQIIAGFFPWNLILVPGLALAIYDYYRKKSESSALLLIWFFSFLIVMSLVKTKLAHYISPVYPAAAVIVAALFFKTFSFFKHLFFKALILVLFATFLIIGAVQVKKNYEPINFRNIFIDEIIANRQKFGQVNDIFVDYKLGQAELFYLEAVASGRIYYCNYNSECDIKINDGLLVRRIDLKDKLDNDKKLSVELTAGSFLLYRFLGP